MSVATPEGASAAPGELELPPRHEAVDVVNLHITETANIGDLVSGPYRYFSDDVPELDITQVDYSILEQSDLVIGGGGLFYFPKLLQEVYANRRGRLVIWGLGLNNHNKKAEDSFPDWFSAADLIGVRDWDKGYRWVPCASCMSPLFDQSYEIKHDVVAYTRGGKRGPQEIYDIPGAPSMPNFASLEEAVRFLASGHTVITTSYHGAYWATLLGRRVVLLRPYSSRFYAMRHPPVLCEDGNWRRAAEQAQLYPAALEECRQANRAFHQDVSKLLATKRAVPVESSVVEDGCVTAEADLAAPSLLTTKLFQRVEETWGKPGYPTDWIPLPSQRRWEYETAIRLLGVPEGSRVLDAGGGSGYMSYILSGHHDVTFNDRYDGYKQPAAPVQKIIGSFFTLPEREPFDAIVCVSVLEHVPADRRLDWLKKIYNMLKPGGVAVITFEWAENEVFDLGDGHTLTTAELDDLWAATPLAVSAQLISPTKARDSRGWLPLAVQLTKQRSGAPLAAGVFSLCTRPRLALIKDLASRPLGPGEVAEVGVYKGGSASILVEAFPTRAIHLFDTFCGIPDVVNKHDNHHKVGDFSDTSLAGVKSILAKYTNIQFHVGVFPDTAKDVVDRRFAFVHVDCDVYQSVLSCCEFFYPRMIPGGILVFDDYHEWSCLGAKLAVNQFFADKPDKPILPPIAGGGCYVLVTGA